MRFGQGTFDPETGEMDANAPRQVVFVFDNGWSVSVIKDGYGRESGLAEVYAWNDDRGESSDFVGWLDDDAVVKYLAKVRKR